MPRWTTEQADEQADATEKLMGSRASMKEHVKKLLTVSMAWSLSGLISRTTTARLGEP